MSTLQRVNFTPVETILPLSRRDFPLADKTLANPLNAVCLVDGEWVTLNSSYQAIRATDITVPGCVTVTSGSGLPPTPRAFPLFAERGRYDVQSISSVKMPVLWRGEYEFDTRIFDATAVCNGGAAITFPLQPLKIATITFGGRNFSGIVGHGALATDTDPVIGYVTKLPSANGGQLRFISGYRA
jgi:hypothetical protein